MEEKSFSLNQIRDLEGLTEELCTMKIMLISMYKSIANDKTDEGVIKWEKECREITRQYIQRARKEAENEVHD